jgi:hypothetical protein
MAAYNFKKQFAPDVKSGKKLCTMRQRRKNGYLPAPGEKIKLYTGMRSTGCQLLRQVTVHHVRPVTIELEDEITKVTLDGTPLGWEEIVALAKRDGFSSVAEFRGFFRSQYGTQAHLYLIEWH